MFQFDISGKDINNVQSKNNPLISVIFFVCHVDISGIDNNDEH